MRKGLTIGLCGGLWLPVQAATAAGWAEAAAFSDGSLPFYVYRDHRARENHYIPSGWMGDYGDIRFSDRALGGGNRGTVIRVEYTAQSAQGAGWAGIYWQQPANNWGSRPGGYNLNGARRLAFRARGEKGVEVIDQFKIGGIGGDYADSASAGIGPVTLSREWRDYEINLEDHELSSIAGGFCWAINRDQNPEGAVFYLDEIRYE